MSASLTAVAVAGFVCQVTLAPPPPGHGGGHGGGGGGGTPFDPAIVYTLGDSVMVMNADASNRTVLVSGVSSIGSSISPDGSFVVFAGIIDGFSGIWSVDSDGANLGLVASYDTRDNTRYPYKGIFSELGVTFVPEFLGSEESYHVFDAQVNVYKLVRPKQVLALRGYGRFTPSDTPYSGLSTLGRRSDLRGYTSGENVAENLISTQIGSS